MKRKTGSEAPQMNNHQRMVFVVYWITPSHPAAIVGVYDDYRDAEDKQAEQPEQFVIQIAPYFPTLPTEP